MFRAISLLFISMIVEGSLNTSLAKNVINIPANITAIVYKDDYSYGDELAIRFQNSSEQLIQEIDLLNQNPPGTCIKREPQARDLIVQGFDVTKQKNIGADVEVDEKDPRYYHVNIIDILGGSSKIVGSATIGVPTQASPYCKSLS